MIGLTSLWKTLVFIWHNSIILILVFLDKEIQLRVSFLFPGYLMRKITSFGSSSEGKRLAYSTIEKFHHCLLQPPCVGFWVQDKLLRSLIKSTPCKTLLLNDKLLVLHQLFYTCFNESSVSHYLESSFRDMLSPHFQRDAVLHILI